MIACCGQFIILIRCRIVRGRGRCVHKWLVEILRTQAEAIGWNLVSAGLCIVFRSAMALQFSWHAEHWQVLVHQMEVASLDLFEHIITHFANEPIIVLSSDVNYEFFVACFSTF